MFSTADSSTTQKDSAKNRAERSWIVKNGVNTKGNNEENVFGTTERETQCSFYPDPEVLMQNEVLKTPYYQQEDYIFLIKLLSAIKPLDQWETWGKEISDCWLSKKLKAILDT